MEDDPGPVGGAYASARELPGGCSFRGLARDRARPPYERVHHVRQLAAVMGAAGHEPRGEHLGLLPQALVKPATLAPTITAWAASR
ncbi:MAG TPA: hypothetical protein VKB17_07470 [Thermoleophilaceae bacterium]|nr:hypothetical protein [Thermoleophilaceae bacterium]